MFKLIKPKLQLLARINKSVRDLNVIDLEGTPAIAVGGMDKKLSLISVDGELLWNFELDGWINHILELDDEIIVGDRSGILAVLSKEGYLIRAEKFSSSLYSMTSFDINGDGREEIIVGTADGNTFILDKNLKRKVRIRGSGVTSVIVGDEEEKCLFIGHFGGLLQKFRWKSYVKEINVGESVYTIFLEDINEDGKKEVIVGGRPPYLMIFDFNLNKIATKGTKAAILAINCAETQWGRAIFVGCRTGLFWVLRVDTLSEIFVRDLYEPIMQFIIADVNNDGKTEIVINNFTRLHIINQALAKISGFDTKPEWIKKAVIYDINNDGKVELIIGLSNGDVYLVSFSD